MKVVISGGSKGLGLATAKHFHANKWGVVSFSRSDVLEKIDYEHIPNINVANRKEIDSLAPYLSTADVLINNAGMAYDGLLATQGIENIEELIDVNLTSVIYLTKIYLRIRLSRKLKGNIINISSIVSERGFSGIAVYSATKSALNGFTRSLAREMGPKGFRVNSICPGFFDSDITKELPANKKQQIIRRTPLGRLATTQDIIPAIDFFASESSQFITGQCLMIDGGLG